MASSFRSAHHRVFTPESRASAVVTADAVSAKPAWRVVRSRILGSPSYSQKVTVPPLADQTVVVLEVDPADPSAGPHKAWGIACFSSSLKFVGVRPQLPFSRQWYLFAGTADAVNSSRQNSAVQEIGHAGSQRFKSLFAGQFTRPNRLDEP